MKQLVSVILACVLLLSCVAIGANAAEADIAVGERSLYDRSFNFDTTFSNWSGFENIKCHIWEYNGDPLYEWNSDDELCVDNGNGIWSFDLKGKGIILDKNKKFVLCFYTNDLKHITYDVFCHGNALGELLYCPGGTYHNPRNYEQRLEAAKWIGLDYGSVVAFDDAGQLIGDDYSLSLSIREQFIDFLKHRLDKARLINQVSDQELIDSIGMRLGYRVYEMYNLIEEAEVDVAWNMEDSILPTENDGGTTADSGSSSSWGHGSTHPYGDWSDAPYIYLDDGRTIKSYKGQKFLYQVYLETDEYISNMSGTISQDLRAFSLIPVTSKPVDYIFPTIKMNSRYRSSKGEKIEFDYTPEEDYITFDGKTLIEQNYFEVTADSGIYDIYTLISLKDEYEEYIDEDYYNIIEVLTPVDEIPTYYETGDVNQDGIVSIGDVTEIQRFLADLTQLNDEQKRCADVNHDGALNITDATTVQRYLAEFINEL